MNGICKAQGKNYKFLQNSGQNTSSKETYNDFKKIILKWILHENVY
jgi:hypothetical protein